MSLARSHWQMQSQNFKHWGPIWPNNQRPDGYIEPQFQRMRYVFPNVPKPESSHTYRIGGYRTPLLIRTPEDTFLTHNGRLWQLFVQYYCIFGQKIMKNDLCEQPEIAKNK